MLIPVILILILAALVTMTAKKFRISPITPLMVSIGMFVVFVLAGRGVISEHEDQFQSVLKGVSLAILLYIVVAVIIYIMAFIWMKKQASRSKE